MGRSSTSLAEDGTWWKAKVINLNPVTGMACLLRAPGEAGRRRRSQGGEKKSDQPTRIRTLYARRAEPEDVKMTDATEEPAKRRIRRTGRVPGTKRTRRTRRRGGSRSWISARLREQVCWSASEVSEAGVRGHPERWTDRARR